MSDPGIENVPSADSLSGKLHWGGRTKDGIAWDVHRGNADAVLNSFEAGSYQTVITSPPYFWQRDYKVQGQIGLESTINEYVDRVAESMQSVKRVLSTDGTLFLNLGDTYYSAKGQPKGGDKKNSARRFGLRAVDTKGLGVPRKTIIGMPWRIALKMIENGWILRSPIIWRREGSLPEPTAKDRPWRTYEMIFMFAKSQRYHFNRDGLGNEEDVWTISDRRRHNNGLHSAAFPEQLVEKCIAIGCPPDGRVLDPFAGTGTVLRVAVQSGHAATGIDLSRQYCDYMQKDLESL